MTRLKGFEKLTNIDEALSILLRKLEPERLGSEQIPIHTALGWVTAEDVQAKNDLPPFDRSAVDGYAVKARDIFGASQFNAKTLRLTEDEGVREGEARQIWTGNPLPEGAEAVIMLGYTKRKEEKRKR